MSATPKNTPASTARMRWQQLEGSMLDLFRPVSIYSDCCSGFTSYFAPLSTEQTPSMKSSNYLCYNLSLASGHLFGSYEMTSQLESQRHSLRVSLDRRRAFTTQNGV